MAHRVKKSRKPARAKKAAAPRTKSAAKAGARFLYLYGISRSGAMKPQAAGVDGTSPVEAVPCAGLACWISRVDGREYGDQLEKNIEDLDWLAAASVRHQRVVAELSADETVLPTRFGTVFLSEKTLGADVARRKKDLLAALKRLHGADEWGVKVFQVAAPVSAAVAAASGRDYLQQKAAQLRPAGAPAEVAEEIRRFAEDLAKVAVDAVPTGKVSSGQRGLEWQASFLLRRADRKKWDDVLAKYARRWGYERRIETTGPWPPYSFVSPHAR